MKRIKSALIAAEIELEKAKENCNLSGMEMYKKGIDQLQEIKKLHELITEVQQLKACLNWAETQGFNH